MNIDQAIIDATARAAFYSGQVAALQAVRAQGGIELRGQELQNEERAFGFARALKEEA